MLSSINFGSNWLFYFIGVALVLIVIWLIVKYITSSPLSREDTFYYMVTDITGKESFIHDSGIRPSQTKPGEELTLQILKIEVNDGSENDISIPSIIKLGMNSKDLRWKINLSDGNIKEEDNYYLVNFNSPKDNPFYGKKQIFPIDLRKEIVEETPQTHL